MGIEKWIFIITVFLMVDTYYDRKYTQWLLSGKKYYKMITYGMVGLSLYVFIKKHPVESRGMVTNAADIVKYLPIDSNTTDLLTPIFDFTNMNSKLNKYQEGFQTNLMGGGLQQTPQMNRMMGSGISTTKRSVSETKKKYIASQQGWKCATCGNQLTHTYEVDHKVDLRFGGSNHVTNLRAQCVGCHKEKTVEHKLQ